MHSPSRVILIVILGPICLSFANFRSGECKQMNTMFHRGRSSRVFEWEVSNLQNSLSRTIAENRFSPV